MPVCKKGGEGGRESRPTDRQPEGREERKEGARGPVLAANITSFLPPSFSGLPFSPPVFPDVPSVHPSRILFHGVKWRRAHLGNVLSIDWNEEEEEGIGGSSRSKSWSFEFPPFPPLRPLSRLADSDKPDTFPASLPPSAADRPTGILFTVAPSSSEYLFCRAIFQADRPTGFLPSFTMAMERVSRRGADELYA